MTVSTEQSLQRKVGDLRGREPGPLLVCVAGIHGNEPAGVRALERVFAALGGDRDRLRGRFVGFLGNVRALGRGVRFIDMDLNRAWTEERVLALSGEAPDGAQASEDLDQHELLRSLYEVIESHAGPVYCIDLHTTSATGGPFATLGDTLRNREFALRFPVVKLLGIEEQIEGGLLEWLNRLGHVTLGFEGGQHDDPSAITLHEAFIWQALEHAGLVDPEVIPDRERFEEVLVQASRGLPPIIEVRHRHPIRPSDRFQMQTGFRHFQWVEQGEVLATDVSGPIRATESGYLLMPLYQGQGEDGFFLGRAVHGAWLRMSKLARNARLPEVAHWLPGVRKKPGDASTVLVDSRLARWQTIQVFHLPGYRRVRRRGPIYEFIRRLE